MSAKNGGSLMTTLGNQFDDYNSRGETSHESINIVSNKNHFSKGQDEHYTIEEENKEEDDQFQNNEIQQRVQHA